MVPNISRVFRSFWTHKKAKGDTITDMILGVRYISVDIDVFTPQFKERNSSITMKKHLYKPDLPSNNTAQPYFFNFFAILPFTQPLHF